MHGIISNPKHHLWLSSSSWSGVCNINASRVAVGYLRSTAVTLQLLIALTARIRAFDYHVRGMMMSDISSLILETCQAAVSPL